MNALFEQAAFLQDLAKLVLHATGRGYLITASSLVRGPMSCAIEVLTHEMPALAASELPKFWTSLSKQNSARAVGDERLGHYFERIWPAADATAVATQYADVAISLPLMGLLREGSTNERSIVLLQTGLRELKYSKSINGKFGPNTTAAVKRFQYEHRLVADGIVGEKTWTALSAKLPGLFQRIAEKWLGDEDFAAAAAEIEVDEPALRAVYDVESGCSGFIGLVPKILFEGHVFWRELQHAGIDPQAHMRGNEDILFPKWTSRHYRGGIAEHARLARAKKIHETAALNSASWGLFQIMGFHATRLGYSDVQNFVEKMGEHEREQLNAFCRFVSITHSKGRSLVEYLRSHDWASFALGYNGAGYRKNRYDEKLAAAFAKHAGQ